jgi:valyl-tRNA synthetase
MNESVPEGFRGLDRFDARKKVIRAFKELGLFEKEESHKNTVPHSDRSKSIIEPKLSKQWYVRMAELAQPAADAARNGDLRFYPDLWKKTYLYWLDNIQDWCISRQLWWGHRIPIFYCESCEHVNCEFEDPTACTKCGSDKLRQDEDVLDTWFSSWLWPLSPFGWPNTEREQRDQLDFFYPTNVLITAPEIIFLWVARMVMAGLRFQGKVPFRDIYFSAVVTDKQGRKFSKTLGNGIDPLEVINKHGADAVRFTGVNLAPLGGRIAMDVGDFDAGARFVNKLWNATRFLLKAQEDAGPDFKIRSLDTFSPDLPSKWLLTELQATAAKVNQCFESYRLNEGVDSIYHFIWGSFCDWGLESAKDALSSNDAKRKAEVLSVLIYVLDGALRLAHPIMPFITEELWQKLDRHPDWEVPKQPFVAIASYPEPNGIPAFPNEAKQWRTVMDLVTGIRSARQQVGLASKQMLKAHIKAIEVLIPAFTDCETWIKRLSNVDEVKVGSALERPDQSLVHVGAGYECYIPVAGLVDFAKERQRLSTEIARIEKIVTGLNSKLSNDNFVKRAPEDVVAQTIAQRDNLQGQLDVLKVNFKALS